MNFLNKYVRRGRRTVSRIWGKTAVVLLLPLNDDDFKDSILELSPDGTHIWKLLEKGLKVRELVDCFAEKKKIDRDVAIKEVIKFIKKLAAKEIVDILDTVDVERTAFRPFKYG